MSTPEMLCEECDKDRKALGRLLAAVLSVCDAGVVVFDERGRFVMANTAFHSRFTWRPARIQAESFATLFPDAHLPSSMIRLPRSVSAGRYQTRIRTGDGTLLDIDVHARWITHEDEDSYWVAALTPSATVMAEAATASPTAQMASGATAAASFADALHGGLRHGKAGPYILAGQVEMTNFDPVRQAAGERWPQVEAHILSEAEGILAQHLSDGDAITHDGRGCFTICFKDVSLDEAERRALRMEEELRRRLGGQFGVVAAPDAQSHVDEIVLLPGEAEAPDIGALVASRLAEKRALIERVSNMTLTQVVEAARLDTHDVIRQNGALTPMLIARLDWTTSRALRKIAAVSSNTAEVINQTDHLLLGLTVTRIYESLSRTMPATFIIPISFATFTNRRMMEQYLGMCRGLPTGVTQHLMFELVGVPDDVAGIRIEEIVASLRSFSRHQILRLSRLERRAVKSWERNFTHHTILYEDLEPTKRNPESVQSIVEALHQRRCRLGIQNVPDQDIALSLAGAGVDFVSGAYLVPWSRSKAA